MMAIQSKNIGLVGAAIIVLLGNSSSAVAQSTFRNAECPFTFTLPKGATIDADGVDVNRYPDDNSVNVTAVWHVGNRRIAMSCTKRPNYPIQPGFEAHLCSGSAPNSTGGECGKARRFHGIEVFYPQAKGVDMAYFWFYTGHKKSRGRLVLSIGAAPGVAADAAVVQGVNALARQIRASVR